MREVDSLQKETPITNPDEAQSGRELYITDLILNTENESKFEDCSDEINKLMPVREPR